MAVKGKIIKGDRNNAFASFNQSGLLLFNGSKSVTCLLVLSDNSRLLTGDEGGRVYCWCLQSYTCVNELKADKTKVNAIHEVFSARQFITVFSGFELKVWGTDDFILRFIVKINLHPIFSKVCEYGNIFSTLTKNGHISIFNAVDMSKIQDYNAGPSDSNVFDISEPDNLIIVGCENAKCIIYSLYNLHKHHEYTHKAAVNAVCIMSKAYKYFTGEINGFISIFNLSTYNKIAEVQTNSLHIISLAGLQELNKLMFSSGNKTVSLIETTGINSATIFKDFKFQIKNFQVFDNNKKVVCSMADGSIQVLDFENGFKLAELYPLLSRIHSKCFSTSDMSIVYSTDMHANFNEWRLREKKVKNLLTLRGINVTSVSFSKKRLVVSIQNLKVFILNNN